MQKRVLVTGGAGYVGSVLVPKLISKGYEVRVLDWMMFPGGLDSIKEKIDLIEGDIRNIETLRKSLEGVDYVIHLAAISNDPCSELDHRLTTQVNLDATRDLIKISKEHNVERFVYASSSSVYGIKEEELVTEDLPLEPLTIYSKTKAESEELLKEANDQEFTTVSIRSATVCGYSPRQRLDVIINILTDRAIRLREIIVNGGDQKRPNIHIDDITDLYVDLLTAPKELISAQVFNYGTINHTVNELADIVKNSLGDPSIEIIRKPSTKDSRSYSISSEKIKNLLGFTPKKTIRDAVLDLKRAYDVGKFLDTLNPVYKNVAKMKEEGY
ncbi:UDP-glucose 4-epimerase [Candidatus Pacearchaeota archaeon]|nr:UDP-glucose 4-epimerase [Candidatus Pacearchaeota archaeon]